MPLLVQSLSCDEQSLKLSTLQTIYSLVLDAPEIITRHVTSLVPMLLGLSKFQQAMVIGHFRYIKIQLDIEAWRTQTKENKKSMLPFINSFCLCPLGLGIEMNFNIATLVPRVFVPLDQLRETSDPEKIRFEVRK